MHINVFFTLFLFLSSHFIFYLSLCLSLEVSKMNNLETCRSEHSLFFLPPPISLFFSLSPLLSKSLKMYDNLQIWRS